MVTMGIIAVLSGMGVIGFNKITATNQQTQCINNLRGISQGLQLYHNDFRTFPDDGYPYDADDLYPLSSDLAIYVPAKSIFVCPEDEDTTSISDFASYDPYYVARPGSYQNEELVIGCPRHSDARNSTSLFSMGSTEITNIGTVLATRSGDEQAILPDGTTAQRTITAVNDVMTFADGSTVRITNASGGDYGCFLVQSVRLADGTLYSIVRVQDDGTIDVDVNTGSKFEIVTPSAIVGVRGTKFTVVTTNGGYTTDVNLTEGTVILMDSVTGETTTLTEPGTAAMAAVSTHSHSHWHANGTYHNDSPHPSLNLAHHGNPALAMKVAADAGGEGDDVDNDGWTVAQGDCDDNNDAVYPGATDIPDNGIDEDCDGQDASSTDPNDVDDDNDEYTENQGDCNDADAAINPGAAEILDNEKDDDCNWLTPDSSTDQAIIDYINDPANTSSDVKAELWANSPLSDAVLMAMLNRNPSMDGADIEYLLTRKAGARTNVPLSETVLIEAINLAIMNSAQYEWVFFKNILTVSDNVLIAAINKGTIMAENHYYSVFFSHKPLTENVLNVLVNKEQDPPLMSSSYYTDTLKDSSPLAQSILDQICAGKPTAMEAGDRQTVLDANSHTCP
jgi:type II secretory pathway pseudopilin PulG